MGIISNSYSTGNVSGASHVGGFFGQISTGAVQIQNSYTTSPVTASGSYAGGLLGSAQAVTAGATISNSYARGSVNTVGGTGGGLVGWIVIGSVMTIVNSYSSGVVTSPCCTSGGFVGYDDNGAFGTNATYTASYWDNTMNASAGSFGGGVPAQVIGANTAAMQNTATFIGAGWTTTYWNLSTVGQYLKVIWQP